VRRLAKACALVCAFAAAAAQALVCSEARAESDAQTGNIKKVESWPQWQHGYALVPRVLGRIGRGDSRNLPYRGAVLVEAETHIWYRHLVSAHAGLGFGLTNSLFTINTGLKINLIEVLKDPMGYSYDKGLVRGIAKKLLGHFMFYTMAELNYFKFPPSTEPLVEYEQSVWTPGAGFGAQWYFDPGAKFARRFYLDTSAVYTRIIGHHWLLITVGIGIEMP